MPKYWVDFECWSITADSEEDAERIVGERLSKGELPAIIDVEEDYDIVDGSINHEEVEDGA